MNKQETYFVLKHIILNDYNNNDNEYIRFRFKFTFEDNKKIVLAFIECFKKVTKNIAKDIINKFDKIGFNIEDLIEDMFFNFYIDYFNFTLLSILYTCFIREGVKIFYRFTYAIFKILKNDIMDIDNKDIVIQVIKEKCYEIRDIYLFLNYAFKFNVNHYNNEYNNIHISDKFISKVATNYYIPTIDGESNILTDDDFFKLWNMFPNNLMNKDALLIYSTNNYDKNLKLFYEICTDTQYSYSACIFIIDTTVNDKLVVLMSSPFNIKIEGFYNPSYIIIYKFMDNNILCYNLNTDCDAFNINKKIICCCDDKIIIGMDDNGPALQIENNFTMGFSFATNLFNNQSPFTKDSSFIIKQIELFSLY